MLQNGLIRRENLEIGASGITEANAATIALKLDLEKSHRYFLRNGFRPKVKLPAINENSPVNHLVAKIRVEKACLKTLVDFAQAGWSFTTPTGKPLPKCARG